MAGTLCPIIAGYVEEASSRRRVITSMFEGDDTDQLAELIAMANAAAITPKLLRIRGFLAIEIMYHSILPWNISTMLTNRRATGFSDLGSKRFARSDSGLSELITWLAELTHHLKLEKYTDDLDGRIDPANKQFFAGSVERLVSNADTIVTAAKTLKSLLRISDVSDSRWRVIGESLGKLAVVDDPVKYTRWLVFTTSESYFQPWNIRKNFQE